MGKTGIVGLAKIVADTTQGKVHFCKAVGGSFLFLTVDIDAVDTALLGLDKGGTLDEHTAGAAAGVYKDAVFDTSPVAGKVYKNSENRRKQGVFCGFRRICWCSICPISAQLRFVWCWHLGSCAAGSGKN